MFSRKPKDRQDIAPINLNGFSLPWVRQVKHLDNILECDNSMKSDCKSKRGSFIGKVNSLLQEFHYVDPLMMMKIINIYATSFYGSCLWDHQSTECKKLLNAWNVVVRQVFKVPNTTHRYLIESLPECHHQGNAL